LTLPAVRLRLIATDSLAPAELRAIRDLLDAAFGSDPDDAFTDDDWAHALGGLHAVLEDDGGVVAHASVVERRLEVGGVPLRTGYVEAVATGAARQRRGYGSQVMEAIGEHIRERFPLGALGTGSHGFYERLGWERWRGPSSVRTADGEQPTPDDDGYIMVLRTPASPPLDVDAPISCDWRPGDVW
jgi:aminoglycoside 2'-N-acetyltransferase I